MAMIFNDVLRWSTVINETVKILLNWFFLTKNTNSIDDCCKGAIKNNLSIMIVKHSNYYYHQRIQLKNWEKN